MLIELTKRVKDEVILSGFSDETGNTQRLTLIKNHPNDEKFTWLRRLGKEIFGIFLMKKKEKDENKVWAKNSYTVRLC